MLRRRGPPRRRWRLPRPSAHTVETIALIALYLGGYTLAFLLASLLAALLASL